VKLLPFLLLAGCTGSPAERRDCERILERIVEIELKESGYRDPLLVTVKQAALKRKLDAELQACIGRRLKPGAMACVEQAKNVEALTHECLSD